MSIDMAEIGGAPVGYVSSLDSTRAAAVLYLRLWCDGVQARADIRQDLTLALGAEQGAEVLEGFAALCELCRTHGRRPLMRHSVDCKCLGADEACFANFVAIAAEGAREDAMLLATLLVRVDMAPHFTALAAQFGLALKRMGLCNSRVNPAAHAIGTTIH